MEEGIRVEVLRQIVGEEVENCEDANLLELIYKLLVYST
jgi:hypothetical protein